MVHLSILIGRAPDIFACELLAANMSHGSGKLGAVADVVAVRDSTRIESLMSELTCKPIRIVKHWCENAFVQK